MIRVLFVDDDPVTLEMIACGLKHPLPGFFQCTRVDGYVSAYALLNPGAESFGIVLMDIAMPGMDGIEATRAIKKVWRDLSVVVYTHDVRRETTIRAINAGADGYISKTDTCDQLQAHLMRRHDGHVCVSKLVLDEVWGYVQKQNSICAPLSPVQTEILRLYRSGLLRKQIAEKMGMSESTLKTHLERIREKTLEAESVGQAAHLRGLLGMV